MKKKQRPLLTRRRLSSTSGWYSPVTGVYSYGLLVPLDYSSSHVTWDATIKAGNVVYAVVGALPLRELRARRRKAKQ